MGNLKPVEDLGDVSDLEGQLQSLQKERKRQDSECALNLAEVHNIETEQKSITTKLSKYDIKQLQEKNEQYKSLDRKFNEFGLSLDKIESEMIHAKKHLDGIGSLTFDDNCEHCVKNQNTPFAKQAQGLQDEIDALGKKYSSIVSERLDVMTERDKSDVTKELNEYDDLSSRHAELDKEWFTKEEFKAATIAPRSNCVMNVDKLFSVFPIQHINDALDTAISRLR